MRKPSLYTIGHGNRKINEFIRLLKDFSIAYLVDVRSQPYSKYYPQYNQNDLKLLLEKNGIRYVFMGDDLGGRPKDITCYDETGKVDYQIIRTKDFFLDGIERLKVASSKNINVVIMCSESKPCECHRSKLIGRVLQTDKIILQHIDEKGKLKDQVSVINELNKGYAEVDLFGCAMNVTSRKTYL